MNFVSNFSLQFSLKCWKSFQFFTHFFSEKWVKKNGHFSPIFSPKNLKCSTSAYGPNAVLPQFLLVSQLILAGNDSCGLGMPQKYVLKSNLEFRM
jgi:hypothetical protein